MVQSSRRRSWSTGPPRDPRRLPRRGRPRLAGPRIRVGSCRRPRRGAHSPADGPGYERRRVAGGEPVGCRRFRSHLADPRSAGGQCLAYFRFDAYRQRGLAMVEMIQEAHPSRTGGHVGRVDGSRLLDFVSLTRVLDTHEPRLGEPATGTTSKDNSYKPGSRIETGPRSGRERSGSADVLGAGDASDVSVGDSDAG